jgi:hypothetical protein
VHQRTDVIRNLHVGIICYLELRWVSEAGRKYLDEIITVCSRMFVMHTKSVANFVRNHTIAVTTTTPEVKLLPTI